MATARRICSRAKDFTHNEILVQTTSTNAELLAFSRNRRCFQEGPLGVINPGACAEILLVNGNNWKTLDFSPSLINIFRWSSRMAVFSITS